MNVRSLLPLVVASALAACGDDASSSKLPANAAEAVTTYARIVSATYEDSVTAAAELDAAVTALLATPSQATLDAAREAWLDAREPYLQTEVFRFYDGPIDEPEADLEPKINAWPLDESHIDYVEGDASAGIVNDPLVELTADALVAKNAEGGDENVATGWHAVEFLLWGQDRAVDGPGDRKHTDFVDGGSATNQARRRQYLAVVSALLVSHLETVRDAWADGADYRAGLEAASPAEGLRRILTGMITLSGFETGGERLQAALDSGSQEDEHSCFSDNTHRDMIQDIQGVLNVWRGEYRRVDGTLVSGVGIRDVVAAVDTDLRDALDARIDASLALANALVPPFDQEIALSNTAGRARVTALVVSLSEQEDLLEDVFRLFDLSVPVVE